MVKLLVISVTQHTPHNRIRDTITYMTLTYVTLNTINGVVISNLRIMANNQKLTLKTSCYFKWYGNFIIIDQHWTTPGLIGTSRNEVLFEVPI